MVFMFVCAIHATFSNLMDSTHITAASFGLLGSCPLPKKRYILEFDENACCGGAASFSRNSSTSTVSFPVSATSTSRTSLIGLPSTERRTSPSAECDDVTGMCARQHKCMHTKVAAGICTVLLTLVPHPAFYSGVGERHDHRVEELPGSAPDSGEAVGAVSFASCIVLRHL